MASLCEICDQILSAANNMILETPCNGRFHEQCIKDWCKTEVVCPGCSGQKDDCRQRYENLEMSEFPIICSMVELEEITAASDHSTETICSKVESEDSVAISAEATEDEVTPQEPSDITETVEKLPKEFEELATAQQVVAERWDRVKMRFQDILNGVKGGK